MSQVDECFTIHRTMSMLDDFVEHSAGPSAPRYTNRGYRNSPQQGYGPSPADISDVEYEGFEVDEGDETPADAAMVQALETGFIPSSRVTNASLPPLFSLSLVQYTPPSNILSLVSTNNILFLAADPLSVIIIDLGHPEELVTIELPRPAPEKGQPREVPFIQQLFADPTARHLLITTSSGDTFYLPISPGNPAVQSRRPRPLRLRQSITAVAWSPFTASSSADSSTGAEGAGSKGDAVTPPATDVLLGTSTGQVLSLPLPPQDDIFKSVSISMSKPLERDLQTVYTLPDPQPVTGLSFGFWPVAGGSSKSSKGPKRAWVLITTAERIYELQGDVSTTTAGGKTGGWAEEVFKPLREGAPKFQELPGAPSISLLKVYLPTTEGQSVPSLPPPTSLAWLTGPGLYTSQLSTTPVPDVLARPSLFPYPTFDNEKLSSAFTRKPSTPPGPPPIPIGIAVSQWHWLLLYTDRVVGVSRETDKIVFEEKIQVAPNERLLGLSADPVSRTFWVYTNRSILELLIRNEDRDVWRAKLEKEDFAEALHYAKTAAQKDIVLSRQGDALFDQGRFISAAQCYAKSSRSFEFVTLRFVDADELDALRIYLSDRLDLLDKKDKTQRMMLATWLVEIYLSKCNTLEDIVSAESVTADVESLTIEREMMEEDMRNFVTTYKNDLEPKVIYDLIQSHGRTDLYLFYAKLNKDYGKVVEHFVTEEQWLKAIDCLNRQDSLELYYRFASVLMRHIPKDTVDSWLRRPLLTPRRLIPALLQQQYRPREPLDQNQAVRYLQNVIFDQGSTDTTIYNLLLTFYVTDPDSNDGHLLDFLSTCPDDPLTYRPYYDLDYALRLCKQHGRVQPCVLIYSKMGMYESSVDLALEKGDLELAKINADRPEEDNILRKKLWLKIAKYVVQEQKDIKRAMKFLESTDLVKIEDILPFFPDFVVIDDFKTEICSALEEYSAKIEELKGEMDDATASAESIKRDIEGLANRFVTVELGDKCWRCGQSVVTRQFYVFPCQHVFHADCLISMAMEYLPPATLRRILHLQNELVKRTTDPHTRALLSSSFPVSGTGTPRKGKTAHGDLQVSRHGITSGSATTDLLLGVSGRNKLLAAGDRLREMIIPDALAQAVAAGVGGVGAKKNASLSKKEKDRADSRAEQARDELDSLVAGSCPLCEGSVVMLDRPFIGENEDTEDWAV